MFEADGYEIRTGLFTEAECDFLLRELTSVPASRAGARHLMRLPAVAQVAHDPRMVSLAQGTTPFRATYFDKSATSNWLVPWHQDTALPIAEAGDAEAGWGPWSVKEGIRYAHAPAWALDQVIALRLHLDDSAADNGPLRVLPGSHRLGVLSDDAVAAYAQSATNAVACLVPPGGVLAMRPLIIHSSAKVRSLRPRRVLHIEYAPSLEIGRNVRLAIA